MYFLRDVYVAFSEGGGFGTVMRVNSLEIPRFYLLEKCITVMGKMDLNITNFYVSV